MQYESHIGHSSLSKAETPKIYTCAVSVIVSSVSIVVAGTREGRLTSWIDSSLCSTLIAHKPSRGGVLSLCLGSKEEIVSGGADGRVVLWRIVRYVDHRNIATVKFTMQQLVEVQSFGCLDMRVRTVSWREKTKTVLLSTTNGEVYEILVKELKDVNDGALVLSHCRGAIRCIAVHPANQLVATVGGDGLVQIWNMESHTRVKAVRMRCTSQAIDWSPCGRFLAVGFGSPEYAFGDLNCPRPGVMFFDSLFHISSKHT